MKVLIGTTELVAKSCKALEDTRGKRVLKILIPRAEMEPAELENILEAQEGTIVCTRDDGTTESYVGYKTTYELSIKTVNDERVYDITLKCVAEAERRALEAQAMATQLGQIVASQSAAIKSQGETLAKQAETIGAQSKDIATLGNADEEQSATIESILLEVIPVMMEEIIPAVVAETLASMMPEETEETEPEEVVSEMEEPVTDGSNDENIVEE